jgi:hypothetical protein
MTSTETQPQVAVSTTAAPKAPVVTTLYQYEIRPAMAEMTAVVRKQRNTPPPMLHATPAEGGCYRAVKMLASTPAVPMTRAELGQIFDAELAIETAGGKRTAWLCPLCVIQRRAEFAPAPRPKAAATTKAAKVAKADAPTELDKPLTAAQKAKFAAQIEELAGPVTITAMREAAEDVAAISEAPVVKAARKPRAPRKAAASTQK